MTTRGWVRRGLAFEAGVWRSLALWVARRVRPRATRTTRELGYARTVTPMFWLFIVMSAIEVPVAHVLLPWRTAQAASLVLGTWGLLWMLGMLAALHVHPHTVGPAGLRVRHGLAVDVTVPWDLVDTVVARRRDHQGSRSVRVEEANGTTVLSLPVGSETTVEVRLREPVAVDLAAGGVEVGGIRLHADDPRELVSLVRAGAAAG